MKSTTAPPGEVAGAQAAQSATGAPRSQRLPLIRRLAFSIVRGFTVGLLRLLGLRGLYTFGQLFGTCEYLVNYRRRRRFGRVFRTIHSEEADPGHRRAATLAYFRQQRCDKLFYLIVDCLPRERVQSLFQLEPQQLVSDPLGRGEGVYVALSHHGPHHVAMLLMALSGFKTAGVRDPGEGLLRRFVQGRLAKRWPEFERIRWFYTDSYPREIYRTLKEGYLLGSAIDVSRIRHDHLQLETVALLGEERPILTGPLRIALRCSVPILQGFIIPEPGFRYRAVLTDLRAAIAAVEDDESAYRAFAKCYAKNLEAHARAHPHLVSRI